MRIVILSGGMSGTEFVADLTRLTYSYAHHPVTSLQSVPSITAVTPDEPDISHIAETAPSVLTARSALDAITHAHLILLAPCCPLSHTAQILSSPGIAHAVRSAPCPVLGISPVIGGHPVPGMRVEELSQRGVACTATGIAEHYGARTYTSEAGLLDGWIVDAEDQNTHVQGVAVHSIPLGEVRRDGTARIRVTLALLNAAGVV